MIELCRTVRVKSLHRSNVAIGLLLILLIFGCGGDGPADPVDGAPPVEDSGPGDGAGLFVDIELEAAVRAALFQPTGKLADRELLLLTELKARGRRITDLRGIERLANLQLLDLADNQIQELTLLVRLERLTYLELSNNRIRDLLPLGGLLRLRFLGLAFNGVREIGPLLLLPDLESVDLSGNPLDGAGLEQQIEGLKSRGVQVNLEVYEGEDPLKLRDALGKIAFERDGDIFAMRPDGGGLVALTQHPAVDEEPMWSPDGTRIAFVSDRDGNAEIYVMSKKGEGPVNLTRHPGEDLAPTWSPDGTRLLFQATREDGTDIYAMDAGGRVVVRLTDDPAAERHPSWSSP